MFGVDFYSFAGQYCSNLQYCPVNGMQFLWKIEMVILSGNTEIYTFVTKIEKYQIEHFKKN